MAGILDKVHRLEQRLAHASVAGINIQTSGLESCNEWLAMVFPRRFSARLEHIKVKQRLHKGKSATASGL